MTWPPLCDTCGWQHINSCEDAAEWRDLLTLLCARADEALADIPPAPRGPSWKADR